MDNTESNLFCILIEKEKNSRMNYKRTEMHEGVGEIAAFVASI